MIKLKRTISAYWANPLWVAICLLNLFLYWKNPHYPRFGLIWVLPLIAHLGYLYWGVTRPYIEIDNDNLAIYLRPWKVIGMKVHKIKTVRGYWPYQKKSIMSFSLNTDRDTLLFEMMGGDEVKICNLGLSEKNRGRIIDFLVQSKIQFQYLDGPIGTTSSEYLPPE